jgi:hypothetical protein
MVAYLYLLMAIIGVAFFIVLVMIFDAVFSEAESGYNAQRVHEFPAKAAGRPPARPGAVDAA